ncbi:MAG: DNRLRE domain-containing protein, partial [Chloroflexota bacterium]
MSAKNTSSRDTASRFRQVSIYILAAALSLAGALPALGDAPPGLPSSFWGTVALDGGNVPDGTVISAWINGVQYAETATFTSSGQSVYTIDVPADDLHTVGVIEGGADGDAIVFKVGGSAADQTVTWQGETNSDLNLSAVTVIAFTPTPTATPMPNATPTQTPTRRITPTPSATSPPVVQTTTYQQGVDGYWGVTDTHIDSWNPTRNYANEGKLIVRQGGVRSALIRFDLSDFPTGHQVIEAKLSMNVCDASATRPMRASLYTLNRPWVATQATWLRASDAEMWGAAGAESVSDDRSAEAVDSVELSSIRTWYHFDVTQA